MWVVTLLIGCLIGATACTPDAEDKDLFGQEVVPIVQNRCADSRCHGTPADGSAPDHQLDPERWLTFTTDSAGRVTDIPGALKSSKAKVNSREKPDFSSFLRKTLPVGQGGQYHFQGSIFPSRDDADYKTLKRWADSISDGSEDADQLPLTANEQLFADTVYPLLIDRGCATTTCHGSLNFGGLVFHPPAIPGTHELSRLELRQTYQEALHNITLWGDVMRARLLTKMLPVEFGGISHKGGNDVFLAAEMQQTADPRDSATVKTLTDWILAERKARVAADLPAKPADPPLIVVGGPLTQAGPFDVQGFVPGTDLYRLDPPYTGAPTNLTAALHTAPADIRDPAISHDGQTIVFSMRKDATDAHNLYTIGIDGQGLAQLTTDKADGGNGRIIGNFGATFGPNGGFVDSAGNKPDTRIYFSSTRAADVSDIATVQNADLYAIDRDGKHLERLTWTVVPEVQPHFLSVGEFYGTVVYTLKRSIEGGEKGVLFRFPIDHDRAHHIQPEAHPHFGMSEPPHVFYRLRELPDGRATLVLTDRNNRWRGGQLALLERQFAVEIPDADVGKATLPNFRHALTILSPDAARTGTSKDGMWCDPTALPDGSLIAAHAPGPLDLSDPTITPKTELVRITLVDDRKTNRAQVKSTDVLQKADKMAWSQPVAAFVRAAEDPPHARAWTDDDSPATLVHSGVQVIEAVLQQLPPTAARTLRDDIAFVRAVVPLTVAGPVDSTAVAAADTRDGHKSAIKASITGQMPLFAAIEVPPAKDGSLAAKIPAHVPVRVVTLDKDRIAVGALQHQWYATLPGETFPVGIPATSYNARCGGCHGALDGKLDSVLKPPTDFVTQASVTAAMYKDADRRVPLELPVVGPTHFVLVDFQKDVQPVLTSKCATAGCHNADKAGGLTLTATATKHYNDAYESLLKPGTGSAGGFAYVDALGYRGRRSFLGEKVMNREYDADRKLEKQCPPAGSPQLTADEKLAIMRWIEFGAAWQGLPGKKG